MGNLREDRVLDAAAEGLSSLGDRSAAAFIQSKLDDEIKRLHNPTSDKTIQLFRDYAGVELKNAWRWNNSDNDAICARLNQYMKLRGDVVHRSRAITPGPPKAHPVTKEDLERTIRFVKSLVQVTEGAFPPTDSRG